MKQWKIKYCGGGVVGFFCVCAVTNKVFLGMNHTFYVKLTAYISKKCLFLFFSLIVYIPRGMIKLSCDYSAATMTAVVLIHLFL